MITIYGSVERRNAMLLPSSWNVIENILYPYRDKRFSSSIASTTCDVDRAITYQFFKISWYIIIKGSKHRCLSGMARVGGRHPSIGQTCILKEMICNLQTIRIRVYHPSSRALDYILRRFYLAEV